MRIATSIVTWRLPIVVGVVALAIGCRQEAPLAPATAAKVAEIAEVNTDSGFVDSIALARDARRVATGERNGSISSTCRGKPRGSSRWDRNPITLSPSPTTRSGLRRSRRRWRAAG